MTRSAIQMMVDRACGLAPGWENRLEPREWVMLECPSCSKTKIAQKDETDPPGTAKVRAHCPECARGGKDGLIDYFDKDGKQLLPSGPEGERKNG